MSIIVSLPFNVRSTNMYQYSMKIFNRKTKFLRILQAKVLKWYLGKELMAYIQVNFFTILLNIKKGSKNLKKNWKCSLVQKFWNYWTRGMMLSGTRTGFAFKSDERSIWTKRNLYFSGFGWLITLIVT